MSRIFTCVLIAVIVVGCINDPKPTVAPNVSIDQQRYAADSMSISFPPETQFLLYYRASDEPSRLPGPDDAVHLKIELPVAAAAKFLSMRPFADADWSTKSSTVHDVPNWKEWSPTSAKTFRSSQIALPKGQALNILVDEDGLNKITMYLVWFET